MTMIGKNVAKNQTNCPSKLLLNFFELYNNLSKVKLQEPISTGTSVLLNLYGAKWKTYSVKNKRFLN